MFSADGKTGGGFFDAYMQSPAWIFVGEWHTLFGCILMGMCVALGSRFWHDLAYGLLDLRNGVKGAQADAAGVVGSGTGSGTAAAALAAAPVETPK